MVGVHAALVWGTGVVVMTSVTYTLLTVDLQREVRVTKLADTGIVAPPSSWTVIGTPALID